MALWTYASLEEVKAANRKAEWANQLAEWSSFQAFREDCRAENETARVLSQHCSVALNHPLPRPPGIETVHNRRAVIAASLYSSELASATLDLRHLQYRLVFVGAFIVICAVITHRALTLYYQVDDEGIYVNHPITAYGYSWARNAISRAVVEPALPSQEESEASDDEIIASATATDLYPTADKSQLRRRQQDHSVLRKLDPGFKLYTGRERNVAFRRGSMIALLWHEGAEVLPEMSDNGRLGDV